MKKETLELIRKVHDLFKDRGISLSVAESCTGGLISHYLTMFPGASRFLEAGVVSYSVRAKQNILGISPDTISAFGVVSKETAGEMAEKIRAITQTDYGLSTTGNLGPDVLEGKEEGLIYITVAGEGKTLTKELRLKGERRKIKEEASSAALSMLIDEITGIQS
jgi:PncC family amidohydrolase